MPRTPVCLISVESDGSGMNLMFFSRNGLRCAIKTNSKKFVVLFPESDQVTEDYQVQIDRNAKKQRLTWLDNALALVKRLLPLVKRLAAIRFTVRNQRHS